MCFCHALALQVFPCLALTPLLTTLAQATAPKRSLAWYLSWGILLALLAASWNGADMRPLDLLSDSGNMARYAAEFFPPNFCAVAALSAGDARHAADRAVGHGAGRADRRAAGAAGLVEHRALVGVPAGASCARFFPCDQRGWCSPCCSWWPWAWVLSLACWRCGIHTSGTLAKLFSEAVEAIDPSLWRHPLHRRQRPARNHLRRDSAGDAAVDFVHVNTASRPTCARPRWWAWWARAASAWCCGRSSAASSMPRPAPCLDAPAYIAAEHSAQQSKELLRIYKVICSKKSSYQCFALFHNYGDEVLKR